MSSFKAGDRVQVKATAGFSRHSKGTVVTKDQNERATWFGDSFPENVVWVLRDGASDACYFHEYELEHLDKPQTSNKSPSFVELLTSISVVRKQVIQPLGVEPIDVSKALYAKASTHISLDTEGDGAYIVIKQDNEDFNGHLQENVIKLDIDEVEAVFSAIKKLTNQLGE